MITQILKQCDIYLFGNLIYSKGLFISKICSIKFSYKYEITNKDKHNTDCFFSISKGVIESCCTTVYLKHSTLLRKISMYKV